MRWIDYIKDRFFYLISVLLFFLFSLWLFLLFQVPFLCQFLFFFFAVILFLFWSLYDYFRKKQFYDDLMSKLEKLPDKYLLIELLNQPNFLEGKILYQVLSESDKDMNEHIKITERRLKNFKEYLELWVHEIKTPLARSFLLLGKKQTELEQALTEIENQVDQVLYYARSETAEKDYYIHKTSLKTVVNHVIKKNRDTFLSDKIQLELKNLDRTVETDAKWLEFICNQILQNSFKYRKEKDAKITIQAIDSKDTVHFMITDNGIGIPKGELSRVFEKSFTGTNGRLGKSSTGMGLYICKNLCDKLGHTITIDSVSGSYTTVTISFGKNHFYDVIDE